MAGVGEGQSVASAEASSSSMQVDGESSTGSTSASKTRQRKRKLDTLLHSLDESILPTADASQPRPSKVPRLPNTLYATLLWASMKAKKERRAETKYEVPNDREGFIAKAAPKLASILERATSRKRPTPTVPNLEVKATPCEYSPSSLPSFLNRLSTFKLSTYSAKPSCIDAVAASRCGWTNEGKDRLYCHICRASWVVKGREGMSRDAANTLVEKLEKDLVDMHKFGCPWKVRQCDTAIYCVPLKPPSALAKEVKSNALQLGTPMEGIHIRHPLTSTQVQNLMSTLSSIRLESVSSAQEDIQDGDDRDMNAPQSAEPEVLEAAALTALFGWSLAPPSTSSSSRLNSPSVSRAGSLAPPSMPGTPRRISSSFASIRSRESTPARPIVARLASSSLNLIAASVNQGDTTLVQCVLCQRKVGLWAFKTQLGELPNGETAVVGSPGTSTPATSTPRRRAAQKRQFDILKEHRSYCPYVARSTSLPVLPRNPIRSTSSDQSAQNPIPSSSSFDFTFGLRNAPTYPGASSPPSDKVEGWRAVLTVLLRTGLGRRQRQRSFKVPMGMDEQSANESAQATDAMEVDDIQAIVDDVKARGGRDLLKYVKRMFS